jgi:hypothetical protein
VIEQKPVIRPGHQRPPASRPDTHPVYGSQLVRQYPVPSAAAGGRHRRRVQERPRRGRILVAVGLALVALVVLAGIAANAGGGRSLASSGSDVSSVAPLDTAGGAIGDGTWLVGEQIAPGTYRTAGPAGGNRPSCYYARLSGTSGLRTDVILDARPVGRTVITIQGNDVAFENRGCLPFERVPDGAQ